MRIVPEQEGTFDVGFHITTALFRAVLPAEQGSPHFSVGGVDQRLNESPSTASTAQQVQGPGGDAGEETWPQITRRECDQPFDAALRFDA
ncbi:hypothetical protein ACFCYH_18370 [Streptomyces sp. NPDC056400]|uniref:hypothetical protein n=1 Tax=Streptomyces sp. NPDC056400 TaxID=3345808 RepID=UPI0035E02E55